MEEQVRYGMSAKELPSYLEKVQSQLPALELLMRMGWQYLSPEETGKLRGERLGTTILEPVLSEHIRRHCRFEFKGPEHTCCRTWVELQESGFSQDVEANLERLDAMKQALDLFEKWAEIA